MRKRIGAASVFLISATILSGCSLKSNYSDENYDIVATYIAHSVLKHDRNLAYRLVDLRDGKESVVEQDIQGNEIDADNNSDNEANSNVNDNNDEDNNDDTNYSEEDENNSTPLATVIGAGNVQCEYQSCKIISSIGDNSSYAIEPAEGNKFYVIVIKMTNNSDKNCRVNLIPDGISYRLTLDDTTVKPLMTALNNDIMYYEASIKTGESKSAFIVFEVPDKKYNNVKLNISSDRGEYNYTIM